MQAEGAVCHVRERNPLAELLHGACGGCPCTGATLPLTRLSKGAVMRNGHRADRDMRWRKLLLVAAFTTISSFAALAQTPPLEELVSSVVRIKTHINPEGQTVQGLGRERDGSGI